VPALPAEHSRIAFRQAPFRALALPPRRPSSTAAGSFGWGVLASSDSPVAMSTMSFARWFGSRGRLGFAMKRVSHERSGIPPDRLFKLRHYPIVILTALILFRLGATPMHPALPGP